MWVISEALLSRLALYLKREHMAKTAARISIINVFTKEKEQKSSIFHPSMQSTLSRMNHE
jgi:hypothetical protein